MERRNVGEWQCLSGRRSFESRTDGFSFSLSLSLSLYLSIYLSISPSLSLSLFLLFFSYSFLSTCPSIYPPICLSLSVLPPPPPPLFHTCTCTTHARLSLSLSFLFSLASFLIDVTLSLLPCKSPIPLHSISLSLSLFASVFPSAAPLCPSSCCLSCESRNSAFRTTSRRVIVSLPHRRERGQRANRSRASGYGDGPMGEHPAAG